MQDEIVLSTVKYSDTFPHMAAPTDRLPTDHTAVESGSVVRFGTELEARVFLAKPRASTFVFVYHSLKSNQAALVGSLMEPAIAGTGATLVLLDHDTMPHLASKYGHFDPQPTLLRVYCGRSLRVLNQPLTPRHVHLFMFSSDNWRR